MTRAPTTGASDDPRSEMMMLERFQLRRKALKKDRVANDRDEPKKSFGHQRTEDPERKSESNKQKHSRIRAEIAQHCFGCLDSGHEQPRKRPIQSAKPCERN